MVACFSAGMLRGVRGLGRNPTQIANIRFEIFPTQTALHFCPNQPKPNRAKTVWCGLTIFFRDINFVI